MVFSGNRKCNKTINVPGWLSSIWTILVNAYYTEDAGWQICTSEGGWWSWTSLPSHFHMTLWEVDYFVEETGDFNDSLMFIYKHSNSYHNIIFTPWSFLSRLFKRYFTRLMLVTCQILMMCYLKKKKRGRSKMKKKTSLSDKFILNPNEL